MLHRKRVATALYYALRRRIRLALGVAPRRSEPPVLAQSVDYVLTWHSFLLDQIKKHLPQGFDFLGKHVCEIGAGDCLATSAFFLARGARHIDIIEIQPPTVSDKQVQVLKSLRSRGYPIDLTIIQAQSGNAELALDPRRITYHRCYVENLQNEARYDFIFSSFVLEHVEDLSGFYSKCWKATNAGGQMLHLIDLGGHGLWEDPLPPLDFQTYPDWLFEAMSPKYNRATRRFLDEHVDAVKSAGFTIEQVIPIRTADDTYLDQLWPKLRRAARQRPRNELRMIEFALLAKKA